MYELILFTVLSLIIGYLSTSGIKTQLVRLGDILIYGPVLIYVGYILYYNDTIKYNKILGLTTILFGATTISYNYRNYMHQKNL
jgi:hypothetical protein